MKSGNPKACTNACCEVISQQFNGGLTGYQSFLHEYDMSGAVKVKRIPGITLISDVEYLDNGDLRVYQSYRIGP